MSNPEFIRGDKVLRKIESSDLIGKGVLGQEDTPGLSVENMQLAVEGIPREVIIPKFNALVDALSAATDGDSGADNIKATAITNVTGTSVQSILEGLKAYIDAAAFGDGLVTSVFGRIGAVLPQAGDYNLYQVGGRGKNLADNPFFTVKQAGNSGVYSTAGGHPVDRWKLTSGTVTINADKTLTLNGTLVQIREEALGVAFVTDVFCTSGTATISYNDATKTITITSSGGRIKAVSLEEGAVSTLKTASGALNHAPPIPQQELEKCQRYQLAIAINYRIRAVGIYANFIDFFVSTPATLRIIPMLAINNFVVQAHTGGANIEGFSLAAQYLSNNGLIIRATKTAHGLTDAVLLSTSLSLLDSNI